MKYILCAEIETFVNGMDSFYGIVFLFLFYFWTFGSRMSPPFLKYIDRSNYFSGKILRIEIRAMMK